MSINNLLSDRKLVSRRKVVLHTLRATNLGAKNFDCYRL